MLVGALKAKSEFPILVKDVVVVDDTSYQSLFMHFEDRNFDLVIAAVDFAQKDAMVEN